MAERLIEAGLFKGPAPRQHVSQNVEHHPIHNAWQAGRDHLVPEDYPAEEVEVYSDYLLNKGPAYGQVGAVHDILKASNGQTHIVEREAAMRAREMIESIEDIDIMTPGAVAAAWLAGRGRVRRPAAAGSGAISGSPGSASAAAWLAAAAAGSY